MEQDDDQTVRRSSKKAARRWIGGFCALVMAIGNPNNHAHASELDDLLGADATQTVSNAELSEQRGGLKMNGVDAWFAIDISSTVNGVVQQSTKIVIDRVGEAQGRVAAATPKSIEVPLAGGNTNQSAPSVATGSAAAPAGPQLLLDVTDAGQIVVKENTVPAIVPTDSLALTGSGAVSSPSTTLADLKPGQILDNGFLSTLLSQEMAVVNSQNNATVQTMRSLTVNIANFSDINAEALQGLLSSSMSSFVNSQVLFSLANR